MKPPAILKSETPGILALSGPDLVRFLNGQVTQEVSDLRETVRYSCVTDAKGRLQHWVEICAGPCEDQIWIVCTRDQTGDLRQRLERYLIADEVEVSDVTGEWSRARLVESGADTSGGSEVLGSAKFRRDSGGTPMPFSDFWWTRETAPALSSMPEEDAENLRIQHKLPAWRQELEPGMLPPEAGVDRFAISYRKGCYIGQEVLSRIKSVGKTNRKLAAFELSGTPPEGTELRLGNEPAGQLTSVATGDFPAALGYVGKRFFAEPVFQLTDQTGKPTGHARRVSWV